MFSATKCKLIFDTEGVVSSERPSQAGPPGGQTFPPEPSVSSDSVSVARKRCSCPYSLMHESHSVKHTRRSCTVFVRQRIPGRFGLGSERTEGRSPREMWRRIARIPSLLRELPSRLSPAFRESGSCGPKSMVLNQEQTTGLFVR